MSRSCQSVDLWKDTEPSFRETEEQATPLLWGTQCFLTMLVIAIWLSECNSNHFYQIPTVCQALLSTLEKSLNFHTSVEIGYYPRV